MIPKLMHILSVIPSEEKAIYNIEKTWYWTFFGMVNHPKGLTTLGFANTNPNVVGTDIEPRIEREDDTETVSFNIELQQLCPFYLQNVCNLKMAHLNVNSVRRKCDPLIESLQNSVLDILMLQETKLDDSFPEGQFVTDGFRLYRKDVTSNAGGIMMYVRSDLPSGDVLIWNLLMLMSARVESSLW